MKYFIVSTYEFTAEYLLALTIILKNAGYRVERDQWNDLRIYYPEDDDVKAWALKVIKECNLV